MSTSHQIELQSSTRSSISAVLSDRPQRSMFAGTEETQAAVPFGVAVKIYQRTCAPGKLCRHSNQAFEHLVGMNAFLVSNRGVCEVH